MQPVSRQWISKHVPVSTNMHATIEYLSETCFLIVPCKVVIRKTIGVTRSVESQPVKRRLGGWCAMAASLGVLS
jgi:hypothetical protein